MTKLALIVTFLVTVVIFQFPKFTMVGIMYNFIYNLGIVIANFTIGLGI